MAEDAKPLTKRERLVQQRAQLDAKLKALDAREKNQTRKDDTRRKVIAGALVLEHMEKNPKSEFGKKLYALLDEYVRPNERRLFEHVGLPPAPVPANDQPALKPKFEATRE